MNCKRFNAVFLKDILSSLGYFPNKENEKEAWYLSPFGNETQASFKLDKRKNQWYLFSEGIGGNNVDFVKKYFNFSISEVLSWAKDQNFSSFHQQMDSLPSNYTITEVNEIKNWNLKKYLNERGLSKKVYPYLKEVKFTINSKKLYAIGIQNLSGGWELRNTFYKGSILKKDISVITNNSDKVLVFEGFIDALSFIELQEDFCFDVISLNSISMLGKLKNFIQEYSEICLFLDCDNAGIKATNFLLSEFSQATDYSFLYKDYKDFNEFLVANKGGFIQQEEAVLFCKK